MWWEGGRRALRLSRYAQLHSRVPLSSEPAPASAPTMAAPPAAAATTAGSAAQPPLEWECVRIKSSHHTSWHLWDVMPDQYMNGGMASEQVTKKWLELQARAPQVVEQQRKAFAEGSSALDTLRCYAVLGHEVGQHTVLEPNFWARLSGLLHNAGEGQVHYFQHGSRRGASAQSGSLVGSNVVAALPGGDYAIVLAVSFDVHSQTYAVLHMPSEADSAVFSAQHALNGTSDPGAGPVWRSGEGFFADGSPVPTPSPELRSPQEYNALSAAEKHAYDDARVSKALSVNPPPSSLRPRYFGAIPAAHVYPYPGRSMGHQYVKGQEVLSRWEQEVTIVEPCVVNSRTQADWETVKVGDEEVARFRPRHTVASRRWTSLLYPAEIVGGEGLEHVTVRYLNGTDVDKVRAAMRRCALDSSVSLSLCLSVSLALSLSRSLARALAARSFFRRHAGLCFRLARWRFPPSASSSLLYSSTSLPPQLTCASCPMPRLTLSPSLRRSPSSSGLQGPQKGRHLLS